MEKRKLLSLGHRYLPSTRLFFLRPLLFDPKKNRILPSTFQAQKLVFSLLSASAFSICVSFLSSPRSSNNIYDSFSSFFRETTGRGPSVRPAPFSFPLPHNRMPPRLASPPSDAPTGSISFFFLFFFAGMWGIVVARAKRI